VTLEDLGWNERWRSLFDAHQKKGLAAGRVVRVDRGAVVVELAGGPTHAVVPSSLDPQGEAGPPAVGDWVALDQTEDTSVVRAVLTRTGALVRRRPGEADRSQAVAANVDVVLVVESVERGPNPRRIERAAALSWDGGATPVVVLTKIDLMDDPAAAIEQARAGAPFIDIVALSSVSDVGLDELSKHLAPGSTAVMLGPSGVGKSTLANRLLGADRLAVSHVRAGDAKGRHTTSHRELVALPSGSCLIDTPGVRELGLWLSADAVDTAFPEIEEAAAGCRFRDCRHESEPGCAVLAEVAAGGIDAKRLASFHRLRREVEHLDLRLDASRRHEIRARERSFGKMVKEVKRLKDKP
jgi:ribosome biogenesis GTPase